MSNELEILDCVTTLLADPKRWTKNTLARDARGVVTAFDDPEAVSFCLAGAIARCEPNQTKGFGFRIWLSTHMWQCKHGITTFNDRPETTHADVMAVLKKARAVLAEGK